MSDISRGSLSESPATLDEQTEFAIGRCILAEEDAEIDEAWTGMRSALRRLEDRAFHRGYHARQLEERHNVIG